uniref:Glycosyltransferase n=1 Tax=uncultured myxobacterium HF0070_11L13 TaxID=723554 RepID=E7C224_9BACT|nr:glycosyltransferase [uncultured myxobacterium HF0070_11L13]
MKILHIVSSATMTGPGDPALNLAAAQRHALGHDVWIAYDQIREGNMIHKVPQYDVPVVEEVATCTKGGVLTALRDRKTVRKLADDFDLIHCHSSHDHGLAALARGKAVLVRSIHHHRSARKRAFQSIAYNRTDGFIFVAEAHREQFLGNYSSIAREQTTVVTGAVDTDWFNDEVDGLKFRDEFEIPKDAFVIGMVARFQAGRGQDLLIEAFSRAQKRANRPMILALIGKGETQAEMRACVKRYGIEEDTRFYGFRDQDLPEAIKSCDITVLLREGNDASCRAILQSLAVGVPVIGAKYAAIDDTLGGTNFGRVIPPDDVHALESAILEMAEADLVSAGAEARQVILEKYSELSRANAVDLFYQRVFSSDFIATSKKKV